LHICKERKKEKGARKGEVGKGSSISGRQSPLFQKGQQITHGHGEVANERESGCSSSCRGRRETGTAWKKRDGSFFLQKKEEENNGGEEEEDGYLSRGGSKALQEQ